MAPAVAKNLQSGFRKCGLSPFNPEEVMKDLPTYAITEGERADIGRAFDESLV